ncbi:MAG: hypothetical protein HY246_09210 [Proteobacteria bacterium]|nr:hypothetical protein [Pseudomonadota bacterium]
MKFGIVGTVVAALCCFTPALVVLLAAVAAEYVGPAGRAAPLELRPDQSDCNAHPDDVREPQLSHLRHR